MQDKGFSQRSVDLVTGNSEAARKLLKGRGLLKAAVGIEPTLKVLQSERATFSLYG